MYASATMTHESTIKRHKNGTTVCTVVFNANALQAAEKKVIEALSKNITIPGFRAGKAPVEKLREKIPAEKITEETVRMLLPATFEALTTEHNIVPIIHPQVELIANEPLTANITFTEIPEVNIKGMSKIKIAKKPIKVDQAEIDKMVDYILSQHETSSVSEAAAVDGDKVTLDFYGEDETGTEIANTRSTDYQVVIGSKQLIPGFEDALIGLEVGAQKSFGVTFPANYQAKELQSKPATFHVTCKKVETITKPTLTEEFVKNTLQAESMAAFLSEIEASMKAQEEDIEHKRRESALLDAITEATKVELPDTLIAEETRALVQDFDQQLAKQKMNMAQWLEASGKKAEDAMAEFKQNATKRVTLRLGMQALVKEKAVTIDDAQMQTAIADIIDRSPKEQVDAIATQYQAGKSAYQQLHWQLQVEKILADMLAA